MKVRERPHPSLGLGQLVEEELEVERAVAQADVARPADRPAVAGHAVDLHPLLPAVLRHPPSEAHRQAVVGIRGEVEAVATIEGGGIAVGVGHGVGVGDAPEPGDVEVRLALPGGPEVAGLGEGDPAPLDGRGVGTGLASVR